jgi:hypothetical protein
MSDADVTPTPMTDESRDAALANAGIPTTSGDVAAGDAALAEVPEAAADAVAWLEDDSIDQAERTRRADLAEQAEDDRPASAQRSSVLDAIAEARKP